MEIETQMSILITFWIFVTLGWRLAANQQTFHIIKIQKMAGISKYYRTKLLKKVLIKMFTFMKLGENEYV